MNPNPDHPVNPVPDLKLTFDYPKGGATYTLVKHSTVRQALKHGRITEEQARRKPWYLRASWRPDRPFKLKVDDADAIRAAKDLLRGRVEQPEAFAQFMAVLDAKRGVTIGELAKDWITAGLPFTALEKRELDAADTLKATITRALKYWQEIRAASITPKSWEKFAAWREHTDNLDHTHKGGRRTTIVELSALSSLCQWAVAEEKLKENPFAGYAKVIKPKNVEHCPQFAPETDEELHRILNWFWTSTTTPTNRHKPADVDRATRIMGAWLVFTALSGLRPEEPAYLYRFKRLDTTPARPASLPAGTIFPDRTGQLRMRVVRTKRGQNPFIQLHPALLDFLDVWTQWLELNRPSLSPDAPSPAPQIPTHWFPHELDWSRPICPAGDTSRLNEKLNQCTAALQLPVRKPKGVGRAYYVAVRRSQGADDAEISGELGQATKADLIREVYGNPDDLRGGALLDWLPEEQDPQTQKLVPTAAAWQILKPTEEQQAKIINL